MTTDWRTEWSRTERVATRLTLLDEVPSTNSWVADRELEPYNVVLTMNQSNGRGRWNRAWTSKPQESLALSVVLPEDWARGDREMARYWIPLAAGTCAVRSLRKLGITEVGAKWPNDVVHQEKKLAGILTEFDRQRQPIIGLGLNVRFDGERPAPRAVSLNELMQLDQGSLDTFVSEFLAELKRCQELSYRDLSARVSETLLTLGRSVTVVQPDGETWIGAAVALDTDGALLVRDSHDRIRPQSASDVWHLYQ